MPPGFPILDSNNNNYALLGDKDGSSDPKNDTGTFYTGKGLNRQITVDGQCQIVETYFCMFSSAVPSQLVSSI